MLALMFAVAAGNPPTTPAEAVAPPHVYLHALESECDHRAPSDEIVVCASKDADKRYRLQPIDPKQYADAPIRAETNLAGGLLGVASSRASVGGFPSNRIMLNFKLKF